MVSNQVTKKNSIFLRRKILVPYRHDSGFCHIDLRNVSYQEQIFTHVSETYEITHYDITKLKNIAQKHNCPDEHVEINQSIVDHIIKNNGVEINHLERMSPDQINQKGIIIHFSEDDSTLIVDGNHRIVKRFQLGLETMLFSIMPYEIAKLAILDTPDGFNVI